MAPSCLFLAFGLAVSVTWAADEAARITPGAQAILDSAEKALVANRAKYDEANRKPLAEAEKALRAEQDKLAKAGKLEEALAIKRLVESFKDALVAKVDARAREDVDLLGDGAAADRRFAGKYFTSDDGSPWGELFPNFTAKQLKHGWEGTWKVVNGKAAITWAGTTYVDTLTVSPDGKTATGVNDKGGTWNLKRTP